MKQFFLDNYQWLFSGVGLVILSFIFKLFPLSKNVRRFNSKKVQSIDSEEKNNHDLAYVNKESSSLKRQTTSEKVTELRLDAVAVNNEIQSAKPFQREDIENSYIGQVVTWEVQISSIISKTGNNLKIMSLFKGKYPWVYFSVDVNEYPVFKIASQNSVFLITGEIISVGDGGFTLNPHSINPH